MLKNTLKMLNRKPKGQKWLVWLIAKDYLAVTTANPKKHSVN